MDELSFFTNDQLVEELVRRHTFIGVVIRDDSNKQWSDHFTYIYNSEVVSRADVSRIVSAVSQQINGDS